MAQILVGVFRDKGYLILCVSPKSNRDEALRHWEEGSLDVIDVITIDLPSTISDVPAAVIRGLASSPDGGEVLSLLLEGVCEHKFTSVSS